MSDKPTVMTGGCRCNAVRYHTTADPAHIVLCHCFTCQRLSGSFFIGFADVSKDALHFDSPKDALSSPAEGSSLRKLHFSDHAERAFCAECGSHIYMLYWNEPESIGIAASSVDPESMREWRDAEGKPWRVEKHIYVSEKAPWEVLPEDGTPRVDTM